MPVIADLLDKILQILRLWYNLTYCSTWERFIQRVNEKLTFCPYAQQFHVILHDLPIFILFTVLWNRIYVLPFLKRFSSDLWSTKQIAQKMCSIFYLSTLSPAVYTHYPQSYPHHSLSILRQKLVIHQLIHIIHKFITFHLLFPFRLYIHFIFVHFW